MFTTFHVHALVAPGEVESFTVTATCGADAVAEVAARYALAGRAAPRVFLGL